MMAAQSPLTFQDYGIETRGKLGSFKMLCPKCSHTRTNKRDLCLSVDTDKGVWLCHYCSWAGGLTLTHAKRYTKPVYVAKVGVEEQVAAWFAGRGISQETLTLMDVRHGLHYLPSLEMEVECLQFPFKRGEEVVNIKFRALDTKVFTQSKDAEPIFFGLPMIATSKEAIITEGELDQLSLVEVGLCHAISVPSGGLSPTDRVSGPKMAFLEHCEKEIAHITKFVLAVDGDEKGQGLEAELARRLGRDKCWRVKWPAGCKDANEVLLQYGGETLRQVIEEAEPWPIDGVLRVGDFLDEFLSLRDQPAQAGFSVGWRSLDPYYKVRPGQVAIVTGIPSSGKSEWLDAVMVNLAEREEWAFGICSLENDPHEHATKLAAKYLRTPYRYGPSPAMTPSQLADAAQWVHGHFFFYAPAEIVPTVAGTLEVMRLLVLRHGLKGVVLDPWGDFEHGRDKGETETEYVGRELIALRRFAKHHDVAVWLVAHPKKMDPRTVDGEPPVPTPYDISGSAHFFNKGDACIAIHRPNADDEVHVYIQKIRSSPLLGKKGMVPLVWNKINTCYADAWT